MNPLPNTLPLRLLSVLWRRQLGRPGVIALALVPVVIYVAAFHVPSVRREGQALQARVAAANAAQPALDAKRVRRTAVEPQQIDSLPPSSQRGQDLARLVEIAKRTEVELARGDYNTEKLNAGNDPGANGGESIAQWKVQLPVRGTYAQLRRFIAEMLNGLPNAALDGLQIDRPDTQQPWLESTLRVTLFYRGSGS
ncbi:MAG: hypothetical protein AB9M60_11180 [Leptothrix sp. (in: b-proteobacteria)]